MDIWDWRPPKKIERASRAEYETFRATHDGQTLYQEFVDLALRLRRAGWRHYTAQGIVEAIRMNRAVIHRPRGGLKVNNNHAAFLAREAMAAEPELEGFFETRRSKADLT